MSRDDEPDGGGATHGSVSASATVEDGEIVVSLSVPPELSDHPVRVEGAGGYAFDSVPPLREVTLSSLEENRYHVRGDPGADLPEELLREVEEHGHPSQFPVVRPTDAGTYELLDGHARVGMARRVGMSELPVHVLDLDPWEGAKYWVDAHVPHPDDTHATDLGFYDDEEVAAAVERLLADWDRDRLAEVDRLRPLL